MPKEKQQAHIISYKEFQQALIDGSNDYLKKRKERDIGDCAYHGPKGIRRAERTIEKAQQLGPNSDSALLLLAWAVFSSSSSALSRLIAMRMIAGEDTHFTASFVNIEKDNLNSSVFSEASLKNRQPFIEVSASEDHSMDQYRHEEAARQFILDDIALYNSSKRAVVEGKTMHDKSAALARSQSAFFSSAYRIQRELERKPEKASKKTDAINVGCCSRR